MRGGISPSRFPAGERVLVVGAREGSLGEAVSDILSEHYQVEVMTAGISGEDYLLDVTEAFTALPEDIHHVVCTVGINLHDDQDWLGIRQMQINYFGVMRLMQVALRYLPTGGHFVAVSSNSAHIARTGSVGYCSSKAALSMGIRCVARQISKDEQRKERPIVYGWEFGLLEATPMTADVTRRVGPDVPLTRMPGLPNGIPVDVAAQHVCDTLAHGWHELSGVMLRLDAGEQ